VVRKYSWLNENCTAPPSPTVNFICFWTISYWTWWQFHGGPSKRGVWLLGVFFLQSQKIWQGLKDFLHLSKPKKGVGRRNNNFFGVQEGVVTTSGEYLKEEFAKSYVLYIR
jgi:hypothetical protein